MTVVILKPHDILAQRSRQRSKFSIDKPHSEAPQVGTRTCTPSAPRRWLSKRVHTRGIHPANAKGPAWIHLCREYFVPHLRVAQCRGSLEHHSSAQAMPFSVRWLCRNYVKVCIYRCTIYCVGRAHFTSVLVECVSAGSLSQSHSEKSNRVKDSLDVREGARTSQSVELQRSKLETCRRAVRVQPAAVSELWTCIAIGERGSGLQELS